MSTKIIRIPESCKYMRQAPIATLTTLATAGYVRKFAAPKSASELAGLIEFARKEGMSYHVIGKGSNILIRQDNHSMFIVLKYMQSYRLQDEFLTAQCGASLSALTHTTLNKNLAGFETLYGIPATIGGALAMNAGGKYGDIFDTLYWVKVLDEDLKVTTLKKDEVNYSYRNGGLGNRIAIEACFRLKEARQEELAERYNEVKEYKTRTQPLNKKSAGCIFRNPPHMSASFLIEEAGLKSARVGDAVVSDKHSNFIINEGKAGSDDVLKLMDTIKATVYSMFNVELEEEILILQ